MGGVLIFCFHSLFLPLKWLVLVFFLKVGNFELDPTSYLFYKFITVVSTILLFYHMYGGWFACGWLGQGCRYLWLIA